MCVDGSLCVIGGGPWQGSALFWVSLALKKLDILEHTVVLIPILLTVICVENRRIYNLVLDEASDSNHLLFTFI